MTVFSRLFLAAALVAPVVACPLPQKPTGPQSPASDASDSSGGGFLSGGTPEPAALLLLAGAAAGYGALRLRRRKSTSKGE
jgi:hypothetical protein